GSVIALGTFSNYELTYKIDCKASGAWGGALINKGAYGDYHEESGYLFYTNANGMNVYNTTGKLGNVGGSLDEDGYLTVTIRCYGEGEDKTIEVISGSSKTSGKISSFSQRFAGGYISLVAGNCLTKFKDVSVTKLTSTGAYA
ncbi:MAG: hypothetical protein IJF71_01850, partial [Clostridia bacterium]|nr:hypothetical protein [Clostridia bacterium]